MCIIAAKPAGVAMPSNDTLRTMWNVNSDGAGFMYVENGAVRIEKGFMKYKNFIKALEKVGSRLDLTATPVVMHFRITTHGGTKPENTHPFPITESLGALKKLKSTTDVGVAHNGIIPNTPRKGISDTMEYVVSQLAPLKKALPSFYKNKYALQLIENAIESKMAFLTKEGKIYTIGDFNVKDGILYSNHSHEKWYSRYSYGGFSAYPFDSYTWEDDPCSVTPSEWVSVSWLPDDCYLKDDISGHLYESADHLIDEIGNVYGYDYTNDAIYPLGCTAYTADGVFAQYDEDDADFLPVLTSRDLPR